MITKRNKSNYYMIKNEDGSWIRKYYNDDIPILTHNLGNYLEVIEEEVNDKLTVKKNFIIDKFYYYIFNIITISKNI